MPAKKRVTDKELIDAYAALGNVHKVGSLLGIRGTSAYERLVKLGVAKPMNKFTKKDQKILSDYYTQVSSDDFDLQMLAEVLNRTKPFLARQAAILGLTDPNRPVSKSTHRQMVAAHKSHSGDRYHQGLRPEVGPGYFRSKWEVNYARYLNFLVGLGEIERWEYEAETFWFEQIKRGVRSYTPDFKIFDKDGHHFVELKGWMDAKSLTKLKRMRIYYPDVDLRLVDAKSYRALAKQVASIVQGWEP